tara:strand:+ start:84 stop:917 length:834 start_codon:yes stop_codon:yes gene_type:complete
MNFIKYPTLSVVDKLIRLNLIAISMNDDYVSYIRARAADDSEKVAALTSQYPKLPTIVNDIRLHVEFSDGKLRYDREKTIEEFALNFQQYNETRLGQITVNDYQNKITFTSGEKVNGIPSLTVTMPLTKNFSAQKNLFEKLYKSASRSIGFLDACESSSKYRLVGQFNQQKVERIARSLFVLALYKINTQRKVSFPRRTVVELLTKSEKQLIEGDFTGGTFNELQANLRELYGINWDVSDWSSKLIYESNAKPEIDKMLEEAQSLVTNTLHGVFPLI